jgi:SAM-dependent methyltransferase
VLERSVVFSRIYRGNRWNGSDSHSGPGSSLVATRVLREVLPKILVDLGITSVCDAGCGDGAWMPDLPGYVGIDVAPEAIRLARRRHPGRDYRVLDFVTEQPPARDAVICRDALQHLPLEDGLAALDNFRRSGARYLLANTHRGGFNVDIRAGRWYEIDLEAPPFDLAPPITTLADGLWPDGVRYPQKVFGVWSL